MFSYKSEERERRYEEIKGNGVDAIKQFIEQERCLLNQTQCSRSKALDSAQRQLQALENESALTNDPLSLVTNDPLSLEL